MPETLKDGDDFSAFMQAGVPQFLQKRALRVLWRSNPVLANLDGLNDYDDDFTSPELTQKVLATGYQVGRGFVKKVLEEAPVDEDETPEEDISVAMVEEEPSDNKDVSSDQTGMSVEVDETEETVRPRRMRFET